MNFFGTPIPIIPENQEIAFWLFGLPIAWYGIMILLGFVAAIFFICMKLWKWYKIPIDPFYWFLFLGIPSAILGARFWSCCIGDAEWQTFFDIRSGGLAIEGGVVLVVIEALIYFPLVLNKPKYQIRDLSTEPQVVRKVSCWLYADAIIPAILIGQAIGRYGNYFNQELYGAIVADEGLQNFLYIVFPYMYINGAWRQPLFFYESIINFIGFILLFVVAEFIPGKKAGDIGLSYFIWYGIVRLIMEPMREQNYSFTLTYYMSSLWVVLGILLIITNHLYFSKRRCISFLNWFSLRWSQLFGWKISIKNKTKKYELDQKLFDLKSEYKKQKRNLKSKYHNNNQRQYDDYYQSLIMIRNKYLIEKENLLTSYSLDKTTKQNILRYYNKLIDKNNVVFRSKTKYLYYMGR